MAPIIKVAVDADDSTVTKPSRSPSIEASKIRLCRNFQITISILKATTPPRIISSIGNPLMS